jgi:tetratricopeptide (TPR) repeat protein
LYFDRGEYGRAETVLSQAAAMGEPEAVLNLAATLRAEARYAEAEKTYQRALAMRESEAPPSPKRIATVLYGLALLDRDMGRFAESEQLARRALEQGADAAPALNLLGVLARLQGRPAESLTLLRQALATAEVPPALDAPKLADILVNLGDTERQAGDLSNAQAHVERAVDLLKGAKDTRTAAALEGLAMVARARGNLKQARVVGTHALLVLRAAVGTDHPEYAAALANLALVCTDLHDARKARELYREALRIDEQKLGPSHPRLGTDLNNLGVASAELHDYASAESYFRRALTVPSDSVNSAFWRANLAGLYAREGKREEALGQYRQATTTLRDANVPGLRVAQILEEYAAVLRGAGSYAEAEDAQAKAMRIRVQYAITNQDTTTRT